MEALEREDLEDNGSDDDVSILELTSYDQLKGDKYSKIMGSEKPGRIRGVGSAIKVIKLTGESSSNVAQNNEENAALRDEIKKLKEDQVHMQNDMEEERLEMKKTVDEMKKANEESQKKNRFHFATVCWSGIGTSHIQSHRVMILIHESEVMFSALLVYSYDYSCL
ncbi:hypothetical protein MKX03_030436 [Papaver bracteatum]|nr:hypothetical protein MKX03_030436 [Papaver bracteatum]